MNPCDTIRENDMANEKGERTNKKEIEMNEKFFMQICAGRIKMGSVEKFARQRCSHPNDDAAHSEGRVASVERGIPRRGGSRNRAWFSPVETYGNRDGRGAGRQAEKFEFYGSLKNRWEVFWSG